MFYNTLWKYTTFCILGGDILNNIYILRDSRTYCQLVSTFIINKNRHPFGMSNPKYQCHLNSVIQLLFPIIKTISNNFQFNSKMKGSISKRLFETAHSASNSTDSEAVKFWLLQNDTFCNDDIQQDSYYSSNNNSTGFSPRDILFSFMSEKYIVFYVCGLRSLHLSPVVYITPTNTSSMRELMMQGMQRNDKVLLSM